MCLLISDNQNTVPNELHRVAALKFFSAENVIIKQLNGFPWLWVGVQLGSGDAKVLDSAVTYQENFS